MKIYITMTNIRYIFDYEIYIYYLNNNNIFTINIVRYIEH